MQSSLTWRHGDKHSNRYLRLDVYPCFPFCLTVNCVLLPTSLVTLCCNGGCVFDRANKSCFTYKDKQGLVLHIQRNAIILASPYPRGIHTLPHASGRYALDNVCKCTPGALVPNPIDLDVRPALNLTGEFDCLNVSLSIAVPAITRRISICGEMHYNMSRLAQAAPSRGDTTRPRTIISIYTHMNATDVGLPIPNDIKKAIPESVYGSTDSTTIVAMPKYRDAYSRPRHSRTALPCRMIR